MQNHFEMLGLPAAFTLNLKALEQAYFTAQRACHPDRFIGKPEADRAAAISRSQAVNEAYETLKNPLTRAEHLLALQGIQALADGQPVAPALLMEMMELRERVAEAAGASQQAMIAEIKALAAATTVEIEGFFATKHWEKAAQATQRLHYLGKAMEEAMMRAHQAKAMHG